MGEPPGDRARRPFLRRLGGLWRGRADAAGDFLDRVSGRLHARERPEGPRSQLGAQQGQIALALKKGDISRPAPPATTWNVNEKDRAWVDAKQTAQPIGVSLKPIKLTGARDRVAKKTYIRAAGYENPNFDRFYAKTKAD